MIIFSDIVLILLLAAGVLFIIQIIYFLGFYNLIHLYSKRSNKSEDEETEYPPLSVIVVAKNSVEDIKRNLIAILEQDYPQFEVIVIHEQDEDAFDDELKLLEEKYKNLYHTFIPDSSRYISHKKLAITMGIKASKYDWIVCTEPDSYPSTTLWLKKLARNFTSDTDVVIGYSNYENKKGYFNRKIIFDRFLFSIRSLAWALGNKPYTASNYNIAYRKSAYYDNGGFSSHLNLQRGEDDIFINRIANSKNCRVELSSESIVRMLVPVHKDIWREAKMSKAITGSYCHGFGKYIAGFATTTRLLFLLAIVAVIVISSSNHEWIALGIAIGLWFLRFIIQLIVFRNISKNIHEKRFYFILPIFDIFQPLWNLKYSIRKRTSKRRDFIRK